MAAGFEYFDYQSSGAPVLTRGAGKMIALLDWALIGKGGWTKPYTGTNLAVYRSDNGTRMYFRVDDTQASYTRVRGYNAMTAVSTGTGPYPATAVAANNTYQWPKSNQATLATDPIRYWGIRTNTYILLILETATPEFVGSYIRDFVVFGDVPSQWAADVTFNSVIFGWDTLANGSYGVTPAVYNAIYAHDVSGQVSAAATFPAFAANPSGTVKGLWGCISNASGSSVTASDIVTVAGVDQIRNIEIYSSDKNTLIGSNVLPRAYLPNLSIFCGPQPSTETKKDMDTFTIGAKQYKIIYLLLSGGGDQSTNSVRLALEITDTAGAL